MAARVLVLVFLGIHIAGLVAEFEGIHQKLRERAVRAKRDDLLERIEDLLETPDCPQRGGLMRLRVSKFGLFWGCSGYPADKTTIPIPRTAQDEAIVALAIGCPSDECDGTMRLRRSKRGFFLGCSHYPDCKHTMPLT